MRKISWGALGLLCLAGCAEAPVAEGVQHSDPSQVDAAIYAHKSEFAACYDASPKHKTGQVTVRFRIDQNGKASQAIVDITTLGDPLVGSCLIKTVEGISFPAPQGGGVADAQYPFKFSKGTLQMSENPR